MIIHYYQTHPLGYLPKTLVIGLEDGRATAQPAADTTHTRRKNHPIKTFGGKRK